MTALAEVAEMVERKCAGTKADGSRCNVDQDLLIEDEEQPGIYFCYSHHPGLEDERRASRSRGGLRMAAKVQRHRFLDADELGRLESPADALRIAAAVTFAVATGRLSSSAGSVVLRALQEWRQAHEAVDVLEEVRRMKAMVEELRRDDRGRTR